jgi:hypothetical protein
VGAVRTLGRTPQHTHAFHGRHGRLEPRHASPLLVGRSPPLFLVNAAEDLVGGCRSLLLHGSRGRRGALRRPGDGGPGCGRDE